MTVNGSTVLGVCDPGCFQCASSNPASCSVCLPGYYIPSTTAVSGVFTCLTCNATCQYCQQNKPNVCLSCYPGAIYNNSTQTCTSCPTNCLACSRQNSSVICTSCPTGYTMNLNSTGCVTTANTSCGQNCATCKTSGNSTTCTLCSPGSTLLNGNCILCAPGCSICSSNSISSCVACAPGNYYDQASASCLACSQNCSSCTSQICTACLDGYSLTSTFSCVSTCWYPCATCQSGNPGECLSCMAGYLSNGTSCIADLSCNAFSNCSLCPFGYSLKYTSSIIQTCIACTSSSNCARCSTSNPAQCLNCNYGDYLTSSNVCLVCVTGCSNCLSPSICFGCNPGYVAQQAGSISTSSSSQTVQAYQPVTCVACAQPCLTCYNSPYICASCVSGYTFSQNLCVSEFNYAFTIVLNPPTNTSFIDNYYSFLLAVANAAGVNYNSITVLSISYGSVTVQMLVGSSAAPGSAAAAAQQQGL